jgi:hypothetical protein
MNGESGSCKQRGEIRLAVQREPASAIRAVFGCSLEALAVAFRDGQVQLATWPQCAGELCQNFWHRCARDVQQRRLAPDGVSRPGA